jgi:hypothetical protein
VRAGWRPPPHLTQAGRRALITEVRVAEEAVRAPIREVPEGMGGIEAGMAVEAAVEATLAELFSEEAVHHLLLTHEFLTEPLAAAWQKVKVAADRRVSRAAERLGRIAFLIGQRTALGHARQVASPIRVMANQTPYTDLSNLASEFWSVFRFGGETNPRLFEPLRQEALRRVRRLTDETLQAIRDELDAGLAAGENPLAIARRIRDLEGFGLTARQRQAVVNYRRELTSGRVGAAAARDLHDRRLSLTNLTPEKVDRLVARYRERMLAYRARTIARTETMWASNRGNQLVWEALVERGALQAEVRRFWVVAPETATSAAVRPTSGGPCPRCLATAALNPDGRGMQEPFLTESGELLDAPPLHPNCRCLVFHQPRFFTLAEMGAQAKVQKYREDQPRVPAGSEDGGQWTAEGGNGSGASQPEKVRFPGGQTVRTYWEGQKLFVLPTPDDTPDWGAVAATEWVNSLSDDEVLALYPDEGDEAFNRDFWRSPSELYHFTTEDRVEGILAEGLGPRAETRGLTNRDVEAAVFTTTNPELSGYGEQQLVLDMAGMKAAGLMPFVSAEPGHVQYELRGAIAARLGIEDYVYESIDPGAADPETIIVYGSIPPKFLRLGTAKRFNPDQPRVPAGNPEGGQWTAEGASGGTTGTRPPATEVHWTPQWWAGTGEPIVEITPEDAIRELREGYPPEPPALSGSVAEQLRALEGRQTASSAMQSLGFQVRADGTNEFNQKREALTVVPETPLLLAFEKRQLTANKEQFLALRADGTPLFLVQGEESEVDLGRYDLRGVDFYTHNHPAGTAGLSQNDMLVAVAQGIDGVRSVTLAPMLDAKGQLVVAPVRVTVTGFRARAAAARRGFVELPSDLRNTDTHSEEYFAWEPVWGKQMATLMARRLDWEVLAQTPRTDGLTITYEQGKPLSKAKVKAWLASNPLLSNRMVPPDDLDPLRRGGSL